MAKPGCNNNTAALTAKGLNTTTVKASLAIIRADLFSKKTTRDNKRRDLEIAQEAFQLSGANNYRTFSDAIDLVSGAVGKLTPDGKQVLKLRKNVTKRGGGGGKPSSSSSTSGSSSSSSSSSTSGSSSSSS